MTKRFELTIDANTDEILLIIDHQDKVMWSFLKDHEEAVTGVFKRLDEQDQRIQELEDENEQLKQQLNMDKTSITSFALYQVAKRFFGKDEVEILNKSHDGIGAYNIIIKKPKSDALMSIFLDNLKRTFNFQDGTKLIISCEIELFKGFF